MTANEMIEVYKSAKKYSSFRFKQAQFKVQDYLGYWRTLFCVDSLMAAQGYITMRRGKSMSTRFRVVDRAGNVVYAYTEQTYWKGEWQ